MSGIFGILNIGGSEILSSDVAAMASQLERRGPDATHCWQDGQVALGQTLLATTPEALVEVLPLTDPDSGCTITADVRLDNRDELIPQLGLDGVERVIGDGELILKAYLRWGEDCPTKLLGDFAFAIWDPRRQQLFCARDHMGLRQLIYHHLPGKLFAFATEVEAVLAHQTVPHRISEDRIADFLDDREGVDYISTCYDDVVRLAPAHSLIVSAAERTSRRYWRVKPVPELRLGSDDEYARAFLEVFTEAVRCRLRCAGPVGAMLSGGVDSGSVVAVASRLLSEQSRTPLHTFSGVGSDPATCIETACARSMMAGPGLNPETIDHNQLNGIAAALLHQHLNATDPFDCHMTMIRAVFLQAKRNGVKVVLDGATADVIMTAGNRVAQLLREGHVGSAIREARASETFWGPSWKARNQLLKAAWTAFAPRSLRKLRRLAVSHLAGFSSFKPASRVIKDVAARRRSRDPVTGYHLPWESAYRAEAIAHPHVVAARERYDRVASAAGVEPRDPFQDIRLIEFCLSLPASQLEGGGWPKLILRHAMRGMLPESVIWRLGKEHLGWTFTQALIAYSNGRLVESNEPVAEFGPLGSSILGGWHKMDNRRRFELTALANWIASNRTGFVAGGVKENQ